MDEASRFVRAANLHYEVGQTVTAPILMEEETPKIRRSTVIRIAAAAACLVLLSGIGLHSYFAKKMRSTIRLCSEVEFEMQLNRAGEVIRISSSTENGQALLDSYQTKNKDMVTVVGDLLTMQRDQGYITEGETVSVYIDSDDDKKYEEYKSGLETEAEKLNLQLSIQPPQPPHEKDPAVTQPAEGPGEKPVRTGETVKPPLVALRTDRDKPEPPSPPDESGPLKETPPKEPDKAHKTETGTGIRHPEPPAERETVPEAPADPPVTPEEPPVTPPVPPDPAESPNLPHAEPPHAELIGPPEAPLADDRPADAETPAPDDAPEPPDAPVPGEIPEAVHNEPAEPPEPVMNDTECEPITPELLQETAPHPEPHPPIPQAAVLSRN